MIREPYVRWCESLGRATAPGYSMRLGPDHRYLFLGHVASNEIRAGGCDSLRLAQLYVLLSVAINEEYASLLDDNTFQAQLVIYGVAL